MVVINYVSKRKCKTYGKTNRMATAPRHRSPTTAQIKPFSENQRRSQIIIAKCQWQPVNKWCLMIQTNLQMPNKIKDKVYRLTKTDNEKFPLHNIADEVLCVKKCAKTGNISTSEQTFKRYCVFRWTNTGYEIQLHRAKRQCNRNRQNV